MPSHIFTVHGHATFYYLENGTKCGKYNDNDLIALTSSVYWISSDPKQVAKCGKKIRVTNKNNGKSVAVKIEDECTGCSRFDIQLSPAAFKKLSDLSVGQIPVTWDFE